MIKYLAQLVVVHMSDVRRITAQVSESGDRIGDRAARHFLCRTHLVVYIARAVFVDQVHSATLCADLGNKLLVDLSKNIDDCIADAE